MKKLFNRYTTFILNSKRIHRKLERGLQQICQSESIILEYYEDIDDLNKHNKNKTTVSGLYSYYLYANTSKVVPGKSTIRVHKKDSDSSRSMILAHELGHHFAIKKGDFSEIGADKYIRVLCKDILEPYEYEYIEPIIAIYSDGLKVKDFDIYKILKKEEELKKEVEQYARQKYAKNNAPRITKKFQKLKSRLPQWFERVRNSHKLSRAAA